MIAVIAIAAGACSSVPPLSAAEYFPAVEAELLRLDLATRDLTDRYASELEAELDAIVADRQLSDPAVANEVLGAIVTAAKSKMQNIIEAHTGQVGVFVSRVVDLVPPGAVESGHEELVKAFESWASSGESTIEQLSNAVALEDLAVALSDSPYADAQFRVDQACMALADNAAAVAVELTCPGTQIAAFDVAP